MHGFSLRSNNLWLNKLIREFYWELVCPQPLSILLYDIDVHIGKKNIYIYIQIDEKKNTLHRAQHQSGWTTTEPRDQR